MPRDSVAEMMEWLQMSEMAKLDTALTSDKARAALMEVFSSGFIVAEGSRNPSDIMSRECFAWMEQRHIAARNLSCSGTDVDAETVTRAALRSSSSLKSLSLFNYRYGFSSSNMNLIARACTNIESLTFSRCDLVNTAFMIAVSHMRLLREVTVSSEISNDALIKLAECCPNLKKISITYYSTHINDTGLARLAECCPHLEDIRVKGQLRIRDAGVVAIASKCSNLKVLCLEGCSEVTDTAVLSLATHATKLQALDVSYCHQITDYALVQLATRCTLLCDLNISECHLVTDAAIAIIADVRGSSLQYLKLGGCFNLTNASLFAIACNCTARLHALSLTFNHHITSDAVFLLRQCCQGLVHLDLYACTGLA
jgi:hypothetical protein